MIHRSVCARLYDDVCIIYQFQSGKKNNFETLVLMKARFYKVNMSKTLDVN